MSPRPPSPLEISAAIDAARAAAAGLCEADPDRLAPQYKADGDPVCGADVAADEAIQEVLLSRTPNTPVCSEERDDPPPGGGDFWLVDPLDGTREFLRGSPDFVTQVALVCEGTPVLGAVAHPHEGTLTVGIHGQGVFTVSATGQREPVVPHGGPEVPRIVVGHRPSAERLATFRAELPAHEVMHCGSAGLKGVRIAAGDAELYPAIGRGIKQWDVAAPAAIVLAAGGEAVDLAGAPLVFDGARTQLVSGALLVRAGSSRIWREGIERAGAAVLEAWF